MAGATLGCNDSTRNDSGGAEASSKEGSSENPVQSWWKENISDKDNDNLQEDLNDDANQARDNINESAE